MEIIKVDSQGRTVIPKRKMPKLYKYYSIDKQNDTIIVRFAREGCETRVATITKEHIKLKLPRLYKGEFTVEYGKHYLLIKRI